MTTKERQLCSSGPMDLDSLLPYVLQYDPYPRLRGPPPRSAGEGSFGAVPEEPQAEDPTLHLEATATEFLETFRRNQTFAIQRPQEGALAAIRTNRVVNHRSFIFPATIPNPRRTVARGAAPIQPPIPHIVVTPSNIPKSSRMEGGVGAWGCECPVPGTKPMNPCTECRKREYFEWSWDTEGTDSKAGFTNHDRDVTFNPIFSVGTVAIKGGTPFKPGYHHYWEVEMSSDVYGTDMMIGVGTDKTDLKKYSRNFVSLIGIDEESWGLSYTGGKHHGGKVAPYTKSFGQHTVVGVHLDLWSGSLEYYINRKPMGKAFSGLKGKVLYPMISSTAARSGMNLIFCRSYAPSLQLQTMLSIGKAMQFPEHVSLFKVLPNHIIPPGLKLWMKNNFWWITSRNVKAKCMFQSTGSNNSSNNGGSSLTSRRGRKTKQTEQVDHEERAGVTTRSMSSRSSIFAPDPSSDRPSPAKSPRVSTRTTLLRPEGAGTAANSAERPITRSTSSPNVASSEKEVDKVDGKEAAGDSSSGSTSVRKMCLRSSKRLK